MKNPTQLYLAFFLVFLFTENLSVSENAGDKMCVLVSRCEKRAENASKSCYDFMTLVDKKCGTTSTYCDRYKKNLVKACTSGFCKECAQKAKTTYDDCLKFYRTTLTPSPKSAETVCAGVKRDLYGKCPRVCKDIKGVRKDNPGKSCKEINEENVLPSGLYWVKPDGDSTPVQSYCDMTFMGGGWTLASYGYVATTADDPRNKNIPNMNHPNGFNWHPCKRNNSNGLISLQHGAVNLARGASTMIMAAGSNPVCSGIDGYSYVYSIDISNNPHKITFANHNRYHGGVGTSTIPKMHVVEFTVKALKGETGSAKRYALGEALGISWSDTYPAGYGFSPVNAAYGNWNKGPFFPSFHSGDRPQSRPCKAPKSYPPDVEKGCSIYVYYGWHSLNGMQKTGQTSIWFK